MGEPLPPSSRRQFNEQDLFDFYYKRVKPLYAFIQATNVLPNETLFEINAAFDHLARRYRTNGDSEDSAVRKALGHLKRSCLDIFKIVARDTVVHSDELSKVDTSVIDNGEFDPKMRDLISKIKTGAVEARLCESDGTDDDFPEVPGFDLWTGVFDMCIDFDRSFYRHPKIPWAKKRQQRISRAKLVGAFLVGVFSSLAAAGIWSLICNWPTVTSKISAFFATST